MAWAASTIAEAYRLALIDGVASQSAIDAWLDRLIAEADSPSMELIDASLAASGHARVLIEALAALTPGFDPEFAIRGYFRLAGDRLSADPTDIRTVTRTLERMALAGEAPAGCEAGMLRFDDAMSLARGGVSGSEEEIRREVIEFLAQNGDWPRD